MGRAPQSTFSFLLLTETPVMRVHNHIIAHTHDYYNVYVSHLQAVMACIISSTKIGHRQLAFGVSLRSLVLRADCQTSHSLTILFRSLAVMKSNLCALDLSIVVGDLCSRNAQKFCSIINSLPIHSLDVRARCTLDGTQPLIESLGNCQTIRTLRLTLVHGRRWRGVRSLGSFRQPLLGRMHTLELDFNRGWLSGSDLEQKFLQGSPIAATQLTSVSLIGLRVDRDGAIALANCLNGLTRLETLKLHLSHSRVTRFGAAALGALGRLGCLTYYDLDLGAGHLTDAGVGRLCGSIATRKTGLRHLKLNVGHNSIGPCGASRLASLRVPSLHLDVGYNHRLGDTGILALVPLTKKTGIVTVVLDGNTMGQSTLYALFEERQKSVPLGPLHICARRIGVGYGQASMDTLSRCRSCTTLQLTHATYCSPYASPNPTCEQ
jgi:hypothetical protein